MYRKKLLVLLILLFTNNVFPQYNPGIQKLAKDFFEWRAITQSSTGDDILRVERPDKCFLSVDDKRFCVQRCFGAALRHEFGA